MSSPIPCSMCEHFIAQVWAATVSGSEVFLCSYCEKKMEDFLVESWSL